MSGPAPSLDWNHVRVFLAVARAGGLGRAARTLRLSEATVGRRLAALEQALGARLLDRLPNRVALTPLGQRLLAEAAGMEEHAAGLERLAMAAVAEPGLPIRITATTSVALFLTGRLPRLLAAAGGSPLELVATRDTLRLAHREAEIALRMRRPPERGDLVVRRVGRVAVAPYASHDHLAARGYREPADLPKLAFIALRADPESRQARWLDGIATDAATTLRLGELPLRLAAVRQGLGASLLPCFIGDREPGLRRLLPPPAELVEDVFLLVHRDVDGLGPVRAVASVLAELFRAEAAVLAG